MKHQCKVWVTDAEGKQVSIMGYSRWLPETLDDAIELVRTLERMLNKDFKVHLVLF